MGAGSSQGAAQPVTASDMLARKAVLSHFLGEETEAPEGSTQAGGKGSSFTSKFALSDLKNKALGCPAWFHLPVSPEALG